MNVLPSSHLLNFGTDDTADLNKIFILATGSVLCCSSASRSFASHFSPQTPNVTASWLSVPR